MKKLIPILLICFSFLTKGQSPQAINYQGVARDSIGHSLINQNIGIRLSILDSSSAGQTIYSETHSVITNASGLFNLSIGLGNVLSGNFSTIPWGQGNKWLKVDMNTGLGNNFLLIGSTQFLSVPYALHAETANTFFSSSNILSTFNMISNPSPNILAFWEAMDYCHDLVEGGYDDWRLPTYPEVKKYVELNGLPPSLFATLTQTDSYTPGYLYLVILSDYGHEISGEDNSTVNQPPNTSYKYIKIQCVR